RRDRDRVVLGRGARGLRGEATGFEPAREDPRLGLARVVAGSVLQRMPHRAGSLGDGARAQAVTPPRPRDGITRTLAGLTRRPLLELETAATLVRTPFAVGDTRTVT